MKKRLLKKLNVRHSTPWLEIIVNIYDGLRRKYDTFLII